jgi:hypothetical protein
MLFGKWLTNGADEAARTLAREFSSSFPASMEQMKGRKAVELRDRAIIKLLDDAIALQRARKMGILRKIIFARVFQSELAKAGYSNEIVRPLISELLSKVTFAGR